MIKFEDMPPLIFDPSGLPEKIYLYPRPRRSNLKALGEGWETINNGEGIAYIKGTTFEQAEAEIARLRKGLHDLRYGIFKDAVIKMGLIDELLRIE